MTWRPGRAIEIPGRVDKEQGDVQEPKALCVWVSDDYLADREPRSKRTAWQHPRRLQYTHTHIQLLICRLLQLSMSTATTTTTTMPSSLNLVLSKGGLSCLQAPPDSQSNQSCLIYHSGRGTQREIEGWGEWKSRKKEKEGERSSFTRQACVVWFKHTQLFINPRQTVLVNKLSPDRKRGGITTWVFSFSCVCVCVSVSR